MQQKRTYSALDSLRGIAALMVCFGHYFMIMHDKSYLVGENAAPWYIWGAGHEAVLLFFVLSGFVMSIMLKGLQDFSYKDYFIRRYFRLYPAYYVGLAVALGVFIYFKPQPITQFTAWFNDFTNVNITWQFILSSLVLVYQLGNNLDGVTWSLTYEMLMSLLFPFLYIIFSGYGNRKNISLSVILIVVILLAIHFLLKVNPFSVVYYMQFFIIGIVLYRNIDSLPRVSGNLWLIIGLILYFAKFLTFAVFKSNYIYNEITMLGVIIIIANAINHHSFKRLLENKLVYFYGKISYSFYLIHLPIMYLLVYSLYGVYIHELLIIQVLAFILSTLVGWLMYNYVELRFITISKRIIAK